MSSYKLRKPQDHDISRSAAAAFGAVLLVSAFASAPAGSAAAQAPCTTIADDDERLACYDRALRGAPAAPAPAAPPAADPPARASAPAAAPVAPAEPRRVRESAAPTAPAAPVAGNVDDGGIIPLVIVGVRALPGRETTFTAEDGTSWVQTDGQRVATLPDTPFAAELKPGAMGSYFLVPKDRGRAIRVRQVR